MDLNLRNSRGGDDREIALFDLGGDGRVDRDDGPGQAGAEIWKPYLLWSAMGSIAVLTSLCALLGATVSGLVTHVTAQFGAARHAFTVPCVPANLQSGFYSGSRDVCLVCHPEATHGVGNSTPRGLALLLSSQISGLFGRTEAFVLAILLYVLGLALMATCWNVTSYSIAQIFFVAGLTGIHILVQIFLADTTSMLNRTFFITLPNLPYIWTWAAGPSLSEAVISSNPNRWRWIYGIFCILVPLAFLPLAYALSHAQRQTGRTDHRHLSVERFTIWDFFRVLHYELDAVGIVLFGAGLILLLLPLTLVGDENLEWQAGQTLITILLGQAMLVSFGFWSAYYSRSPFIPFRLLSDRTMAGSFCAGFLYFMSFYLWDNYFYQFMIVTRNTSFANTGRITQTFDLVATITTLVAGMAIKRWDRYRYLVVASVPIYLSGIGLMIVYRVRYGSIYSIVLAQVIVGIGGGLFTVPAQVAVQAVSKQEDVALATALYLTSVSLGGAFGSALAGAVWQNRLLANLIRHAPLLSAADRRLIIDNYQVLIERFSWGTLAREEINAAFNDTLKTLCSLAWIVAAFMLPAVLFIRELPLSSQHTRGYNMLSAGTSSTVS